MVAVLSRCILLLDSAIFVLSATPKDRHSKRTLDTSWLVHDIIIHSRDPDQASVVQEIVNAIHREITFQRINTIKTN